MRLLLVNYEYPPLGGGGGLAHRAIAESLALRHRVTVLTTHARRLAREERINGVKIIRLPVWGRTDTPTATLRSMLTFVPSALLSGWSLIRSCRPDLIHAFFAVPSGLPAVILGRWYRIPVVLTLVGADVFDPAPTAGIAAHKHPLVRAIVRSVIRASTLTTAISEDTKQRACQYHGASAAMPVIPLSLRFPEFAKSGEVASRGRPRTRLLAIGRLIPRKAHQDLITALALLNRPEVNISIVGEGPLAASLSQQAVKLGLKDRVNFEGVVEESRKWELLRDADVFVSASLHEGFGLVFLEAMYAGVPIICTDVGGHTDILSPGRHALFVRPHHPRQLAAALQCVLDDKALAQRLIESGKERVRAFRLDQTVAAYEQLFERARRHHLGTALSVPPVAVRSTTHETGR